MTIINWVKSHKLVVLLLLIIAFLYFGSKPVIAPLSKLSERTAPAVDYGIPPQSTGIATEQMILPPDYQQNFSDTQDRIVTQNSDLSMVVENVRQTGDRIISHAESIGGFMVYASYNRPEESPFANVTVRIPTENLNESLDYIRSLSVKIISENLVGTDVTDQYVDIEARLETLETTKTKFEEILDQAVEIQDILTVQREIINLQRQIDSLVGQKESIENNAKLTKVTVFLSTDELALPYAPDKAFRPELTFKMAVRSLLTTLRDGADTLIWIGVYSIIWIPLLIIGFVIYKKFIKKQQRLN